MQTRMMMLMLMMISANDDDIGLSAVNESIIDQINDDKKIKEIKYISKTLF